MDSRKYILGLIIVVLVLSINLVCAADYKVAYIYKSKSDKNIVDLFSSLRLKVELIKENNLPSDLSEYKFIFIGDENFAKNISIDKYPSVVMNHYIPKKIGLVNNVGISQLVSNKPLFASANGKSVQVYTASKDSKGASLSYYYLDHDNMASSLEQSVGTYATSSGADFGSVSAIGSSGDVLVNGDVLTNNLCFFGITKTSYWATETQNLFLDCVKYVFDYTTMPPDPINCTMDSDCGTNRFIGSGTCKKDDVFKNYITYRCYNPGETTSYCSSVTSSQLFENCIAGCNNGKCNSLTCSIDSDCDDGNLTTEDKCVNQGTADSICIHNIYINIINNITTNVTNNITTNVTQIKLMYFVATPGINNVIVNFSATSGNDLVRGYLLSRDRERWTLVLSPATGYIFDGLAEGTDYIFYAKAIDVNGVNSEEMSISLTTLNKPADPAVNPGSSGGGGGGSIVPLSGGFSYCSTNWECGEWSECSNGKQTRTCFVPAGKCAPEVAKPSENQICVEGGGTSSENSNVAAADVKSPLINEGEGKGSNLITGASIADTLGKYSWLGAGIVLFIIAGIGYWYFKVK